MFLSNQYIIDFESSFSSFGIAQKILYCTKFGYVAHHKSLEHFRLPLTSSDPDKTGNLLTKQSNGTKSTPKLR